MSRTAAWSCCAGSAPCHSFAGPLTGAQARVARAVAVTVTRAPLPSRRRGHCARRTDLEASPTTRPTPTRRGHDSPRLGSERGAAIGTRRIDGRRRTASAVAARARVRAGTGAGGDRGARRRPRDGVRNARVQRFGPALRTEAIRRGRGGDDAQLDERRGRRLRLSESGQWHSLRSSTRASAACSSMPIWGRSAVPMTPTSSTPTWTAAGSGPRSSRRGRRRRHARSSCASGQSRRRKETDAPTEVYLCHDYCELGAVRLADVVDEIRRFLDDNSGEVLVVLIQDELPPERLLPVLEEGGLDPYLATLDAAQPLPTLGSMVETGRRVVLALENGDLGPPERVRERTVPGGALQVPLGGPARGPRRPAATTVGSQVRPCSC